MAIFLAGPGAAQYRPPIFGVPAPTGGAPAESPNLPAKVPRPNAVEPDKIRVSAVTQEVEGPMRRLRGKVELETTEMILKADEIDYNEETGDADARGHVYFENFDGGEILHATRVEYNLREEVGKFHQPSGTFPAKLEARPGVLTSANPFAFAGQWAERLKDRYILHEGFITSCKIPKPWWVLKVPKFDLIPDKRAIAHRARFAVRGVPLFYTPYFFKSLERQPRKSGFLTPNFGTSSRRGAMYGLGYYWAINRSYDVLYRSQYFTKRGFAHTADLRGKPREGSDFNLFLYGVNDRGLQLPDGSRRKEGGFLLSFLGVSDVGRGWHARGQVNYLSNFRFRQAFTESFNEAIFSEVNSIGFLAKQWRGYSVDIVFSRLENYQSLEPNDRIVIRRLPEIQFASRDKQLWDSVPVWVSFEASNGLMRRNQPLFQTRQYVERFDAAPRVMSAWRWRDFHLVPSFTLHETYQASSQTDGRITGSNVNRLAQDFSLDLVAPSLARVFDVNKNKAWLGDKLKHVIEPRAGFRYVSGVDNFSSLVRYDLVELLSNTSEASVSITNRLYSKRGNAVSEILSWEVWQKHYFDADFGRAIIPGQRNVFLSSTEMTAFAFIDRARNYSPIVSALRATPRPGLGLEWRADYDPLRGGFSNSSFTADGRLENLFLSLGHNHVRSERVLSPSANQFRGLIGLGKENRRGWNAGFFALYDYRVGVLQFANTQITYNTDCCGFSLQYRRFSFGTRNENQFRVAFAVANIGSFGTLRRQERFF